MKTKFACTLLVLFKPPLSYPSPPFPGFFTSYTIFSCLLHSSPSLFFYTLLCCNMYFRFGNCGFCNNIATKSTCSKKRFTKKRMEPQKFRHFLWIFEKCKDFKWKPYQWKVQWISQKVNNIPFQPTLSTDYARVFCIYSS